MVAGPDDLARPSLPGAQEPVVDAVGAPASRPPGAGPRLRSAMVAVGLLVAVAAALAIPAQAGYGARTVADEPYYLLSADSLFHQRTLDISDDLRAERWRSYHRVALPEQAARRADGRRLSPHDPLLPAILAVPMGLGGWVAAKATLAVLAGLLAALLVWTAVVRFAASTGVAAAVVAAFGVVPPLVSYGTQVYPELPAALAVTVAVAAITGPLGRRGRWVAVLAVVALPWLAVKYAPVALALAVVLLVTLWRRGDRAAAGRGVAALVVAGIAFLAWHQAIYGGWTVYAAGDHFGGGELTVVGTSPDYPARSLRLLGLLTDHDFGLMAWAPAYVVVVPALAALVRRRPRGTSVIALPLAAGWLNATFVALTMHGWWWPGRQVVVVLPLAVLAVAWWAGTIVDWIRLRRWLFAATAVAVVWWYWLVAEVVSGGRALIIDFAQTGDPLSKAWRLLLPDGRVLAPIDVVRLVGWGFALAGLATWEWHRAAVPGSRSAASTTPTATPTPTTITVPTPERTPS